MKFEVEIEFETEVKYAAIEAENSTEALLTVLEDLSHKEVVSITAKAVNLLEELEDDLESYGMSLEAFQVLVERWNAL